MRYEVRLAGTGGQGQILAGIILADAAAVYDGVNAVQTQSYGPESRGGASRAEVVISEEEIDYPKVTAPHVLLAMSQKAYDTYAEDVRADGLIVADTTLVSPAENGPVRTLGFPITEAARKELGRVIVANMVALGIVTVLTGRVSREAVKQALASRVPRGTEELNLRALEYGFHLAERGAAGEMESGRGRFEAPPA